MKKIILLASSFITGAAIANVNAIHAGADRIANSANQAVSKAVKSSNHRVAKQSHRKQMAMQNQDQTQAPQTQQ